MDYSNQLDLFNPELYKNTSISIVGVGAIGSFVTLILSKMGMKKINVYDGDSVEEHNIPNQFYKLKQIGVIKTVAIKNIVKEYADTEITENGKVDNNTLIVSDIVILCTDSMKSRKLAYKKSMEFTKYIIDARMNGNTYRIYTFDIKNEEHCKMYESSLYLDKHSDIGKCTEKTIIYNVAEIASKIANQIKKIEYGEKFSNFLAYDFKNDLLIKRTW